MDLKSFNITDDGQLSIYGGTGGISLAANQSHGVIYATELTDIVSKAFACIAALFGFGVVSSVLIKEKNKEAEYKTFWCDRSISKTWDTSTSMKLETIFSRIFYEEIQEK